MIAKILRLLLTQSGRRLSTQSLRRLEAERRQAEASTPRSLSSMTSLCLPRVLTDFPFFNWPQMRALCMQALADALSARASGSLEAIAPEHTVLRGQLEDDILADRQQGIRRHISGVRVHGMEIVRYLPHSGAHTLILQAAVGARCWAEQNGRLIDGDRDWDSQLKFEMQLLLVQDAGKADGGALALNCPNCGAPLSGASQRACAYCGSALEALGEKLWRVGRIKRVL